eukprot:TRINITY_DN22_c0_g1_i1.p1 TRINITY_DN22_c0_g1~~TRINITY_DN22_c0_g1_i1.p1  ORF type:complete len:351 (+),score=48.86 TRINITY_DN22_c0_g1_i1:130-1182(+)
MSDTERGPAPRRRWPASCFRTRTAKEMLAEILGTYIYVVLGLAAWASYALQPGLFGLWQVGVVWAFALALGMLISWHTSGGHLNPAVTLAMVIFRHREYPWWKLFTYIPCQFLGAMLAAATIFACYYDAFKRFERSRGIDRNGPEGVLSGMVFCDYFPNPAIYGYEKPATDVVRPAGAFAIELFCTALFVFIFFAFSDAKNRFLNRSRSGAWLGPIMIGITLGLLIAGLGPLVMVAINPARDLGARIIALLAGWWKRAIPGPRSGFWVYIIGPLAGGLIGALLYQFLMHLALPSRKDIEEMRGPYGPYDAWGHNDYELDDIDDSLGTYDLRKSPSGRMYFVPRNRHDLDM